MHWIRKPRDMLAGMLFLIVGVAVILITSQYDFGTPRRMGPGFFPVGLGGVLCGLAVLIMLQSLIGRPEQMEPLTAQSLRAAFLVLVGTLLYGLLVRRLGMIPSIMIMVLLGSLAMKGYGWKAAILTAVILTAGSVLIFVWLLGQPIPLFGTGLGL
jgi:hypothetical protein